MGARSDDGGAGRTHIDQHERGDRHSYIDRAHKDPNEAALVRQERLEHGRRVEQDGVDAGELLDNECERDEEDVRANSG